MLLRVRSRMKEHKATMNLRYDDRMEQVVRKLELRPLRIGGEYAKAEDPVVEALAQRMQEVHESFDSVIAPGGSGIEPSLYLFGGNPTEVVELALKAAGLYSIGGF
jgi:predicted fused transcriptional regulator/phosphomethylpyrimidine kinase